MKKLFYTFLFSFMMLLVVSPAMAQNSNDGPPDPGGDPGSNPPMGGGAPIGGGTFILMALGAAYGSKKLYTLNKESEKE